MKVNLQIEERVKFSHEITIEIPEGIDVDEFLTQKVDKQIKHCDFSDTRYILSKIDGVKVLDYAEDDSGDMSDTEIIDFEEI